MAKPSFVQSILAETNFDSADFWRKDGRGGWATAAALLLLVFLQVLRAFRRRRAVSPFPGSLAASAAPASSPLGSAPARISIIITDAELKDLVTNLDSRSSEGEIWEEVIAKKNGSISYNAKCCKPKDGPMKYLSLTIFDKCTTELLRDFYMDNQYRRNWDKTLIEFEQLQADETSGTEIGRMVKKFPLLTPREYILAWKVWKGRDKTFYCFTKVSSDFGGRRNWTLVDWNKTGSHREHLHSFVRDMIALKLQSNLRHSIIKYE